MELFLFVAANCCYIIITITLASRYIAYHLLHILHVHITVILAGTRCKSSFFKRRYWHWVLVDLVPLYFCSAHESLTTFVTSFYCHLFFFLPLFLLYFSLFFSWGSSLSSHCFPHHLLVSSHSDFP